MTHHSKKYKSSACFTHTSSNNGWSGSLMKYSYSWNSMGYRHRTSFITTTPSHTPTSQRQETAVETMMTGQPINQTADSRQAPFNPSARGGGGSQSCAQCSRNFQLKENNRCSFKKNQLQTPNIILLHKFIASEYLENKNTFASPHRVSGRQTQRRVYIFLIYVLFPWWTPQSVRHCLGMSHKRSFQGIALEFCFRARGNRGLGFLFLKQGELSRNQIGGWRLYPITSCKSHHVK